MPIPISNRHEAEVAKLAFMIVFLLSFPAYTQVADKRVLLISIPDRQLALLEDGQVKKVYAVAVGKDSTPSPNGSFHIVVRVVDPTYYHEGKVIAPGPQNPLGTRWMGLGYHGYGIHGTNAPKSIGKAASHGCIRMAKRDLEELFTLVKIGDEVEIRGERDAQTAAVFGSQGAAPATTVVAEIAAPAMAAAAGQ
jgi:hypothetical protein